MPDRKRFESNEEYNKWFREYKRKRKVAMLEKLAGKGNPTVCKCCGLDDIRFLTIDHIEPMSKSGLSPLRWTYKMRYAVLLADVPPPGFQILCYNCNMAKSTKPYCPHQMDRLIHKGKKDPLL